MKRVFLILLMQCSLFAFGQEKENKLTVKEIIFNGSFDSKNKIVQISKDEQTSRTLMKINTQKPEPMVKYIILENDRKGTAIASSYMLSKEEIKSDDDLFKFSINSYDVIYNDPSLSKANQDAGKDKTIKVGMKHNGEPIDLSTANLLPSCAEGEGFCIDWYWQTWVNGELIDETPLYTTCNCGGGGGGGTGPGNGLPLTPEEQCSNAMNSINGSSIVQILESSSIPIDEFSKQMNWRTRIYNSSAGFSLESNDQGTAKKASSGFKWLFSSFNHNSITQNGICTVPEVNITFTEDSQSANWDNTSLCIFKLNYTINEQCIINNPSRPPFIGQLFSDAKTVTIIYSANNDNSAILVNPPPGD